MPPGDYDKEDLLPSHAHIKETTAEIRRRQSRMYPPSQPRKSNTYNNLYKSCTPGTSLENGHCKEKTIYFAYNDINVKIKEKPNEILKVLP